MNRTAWKWILTVSLSLNIGIVATVALKQLQPQPAALSSQAVNLPDYLQLDQQQRQRWHELERVFVGDLSANWRDIRAHREALVRQVFSAGPDLQQINAQQAAIAALQNLQQQRVIRQLLAERDLLNEEQRAKLLALLLSRYSQEATEEEQLHRD